MSEMQYLIHPACANLVDATLRTGNMSTPGARAAKLVDATQRTGNTFTSGARAESDGMRMDVQ